jgi:3-hydroxybutyryl-CoA dehydrogenase
VGAGVMGTGVAQDLAQHGFRPILVDVSQTALDAALQRIRKNVRAAGMFARSKPGEAPEEVLARVSATTDYDSLSGADFVIENATEDVEIKRPIYETLDTICPKDCVLIADTSCIPITRLASFTKRPAQVIGIHFMNPVPMKLTVEMIPGSETSAQTIDKAKSLMEQLGKTSIVVKDSPGFVSNRVLMLTINEAIRVLEEGVADAQSVDGIFKACFGHAMGPLETADLIGLDTILLSLEVLRDSFEDAKYEPCRLLKDMVDEGRLGRKSGAGFHPYT